MMIRVIKVYFSFRAFKSLSLLPIHPSIPFSDLTGLMFSSCSVQYFLKKPTISL